MPKAETVSVFCFSFRPISRCATGLKAIASAENSARYDRKFFNKVRTMDFIVRVEAGEKYFNGYPVPRAFRRTTRSLVRYTPEKREHPNVTE